MNEPLCRLKALPKVDLHLHLDGSVLPETLIELAKSSGASLPEWEPLKLRPFMQVEQNCDNLSQYLEKFAFANTYLQSVHALERVAYELVRQCAEHQCRYIEVRFAPELHRAQGLSIEETIEGVLEGLGAGESDFGVISRCIVICLRGHTRERNIGVIRRSAPYYGRGVVAVDLAGSEGEYPPGLYEEEFTLARSLGFPVTIHAGEAAGAESVETAVKVLGASRIGHGVRMWGNEKVIELIRSRGITLEMCPISNLQTKATSSWKAYPLRAFIESGIRVAVCTDNWTVSDTTITKEYEVLRKELSFSDAELCAIVINGAKAAFLEDEAKRQLCERLAEELKSWLAATPTH